MNLLSSILKWPDTPALGAVDVTSLEDCINEMSRFGPVRLHQYDDGTWNCTCKMRVSVSAASLEVKSKCDHKTAMEAATVCLRGIRDTINSLNRTAIGK